MTHLFICLSFNCCLSDFYEDSYLGNPLFAAVVNSFPSVDTFLLIGATLLAYSTMKELDKKNGGDVKFWSLFYFHRYVRLTGVYAIVIGFHATLLKYFTHGARSHYVQDTVDTCQQDWWKNILYINNFMVTPVQYFLHLPSTFLISGTKLSA